MWAYTHIDMRTHKPHMNTALSSLHTCCSCAKCQSDPLCICLKMIPQTEGWGMRVLQSTCGWLMSVGCSPCCGVRGQVQLPPTPATSWKTWTSPTWSWWAEVSSVHCFHSCQLLSLNIQSKCLCLCASVTQEIQDHMDYTGYFVFFDNDWNLHFVLVRWATVCGNYVSFYTRKHVWQFDTCSTISLQENTVPLSQRR